MATKTVFEARGIIIIPNPITFIQNYRLKFSFNVNASRVVSAASVTTSSSNVNNTTGRITNGSCAAEALAAEKAAEVFFDMVTAGRYAVLGTTQNISVTCKRQFTLALIPLTPSLFSSVPSARVIISGDIKTGSGNSIVVHFQNPTKGDFGFIYLNLPGPGQWLWALQVKDVITSSGDPTKQQ